MLHQKVIFARMALNWGKIKIKHFESIYKFLKILNYTTCTGENMAWIPMIQEDKAEADLKEWYDKLREPWGGVDNIMKIHSLNVNTLKSHYELYLSAMKGTKNLSYKQREMIAVVVSNVNQCHY